MPPEFVGKWRMEYLNTRFPLPALLCAVFFISIVITNVATETCSEPDDCKAIPLCPEAQKLAEYRHNNQTVKLKFIYSICGTTRIGKRPAPMVST